MLSSLSRTDPEKFQEALKNSMDKVIREPEARMFLAEHIPTANPQAAKDKITRLYRTLENSRENQKDMAKALAEFRLEEVPTSCLPFSESFISIF